MSTTFNLAFIDSTSKLSFFDTFSISSFFNSLILKTSSFKIAWFSTLRTISRTFFYSSGF